MKNVLIALLIISNIGLGIAVYTNFHRNNIQDKWFNKNDEYLLTNFDQHNRMLDIIEKHGILLLDLNNRLTKLEQ